MIKKKLTFAHKYIMPAYGLPARSTPKGTQKSKQHEEVLY